METVSADDPRLYFVPLAKATVPPAGLIEHIQDMWWVMHPEKGVVYFGKGRSAQCNINEGLTRRLAAMYPWAEIKYIPSVFRSINPNDYVF